jgi:hypothetical protein
MEASQPMRKLNFLFTVFAIALCLSSAPVQAGIWTTVDFPGARSTMITGLSGNNLAGNYTDASGVNHGFLFKDNAWTSFDAPSGATFMQVTGIDGGNVVGSYLYGSGTWGAASHGFIYDGSNWITFDLPGATSTSILGIDGNNIIGSADGGTCFVYNLSTFDQTIIESPAAVLTYANGIDGANIVGSYIDIGSLLNPPDSVWQHGFIYDMTTQIWLTLDMPGARGTRIGGIDGGNIVGWGLGSFVYNMTTDTWILLNVPGAGTTYVQDIDRDNIVGYYLDDSLHTHGFLYTIPEPTAEAGPDQTIYADVNGLAKVALDGSDSNDPDGYVLAYKWTRTIDANTYEANSVNPTIELPVGVHTITLVVNDGFSNSAPDDVNITVIAPFECKMKITPQTINRKSNQPYIQAVIELPANIATSDIDTTEPLMMYPGAIPARNSQGGMAGRGDRPVAQNSISPSFDKDSLMAAAPTGDIVLTVVGKLKTAQYFCASDTVKIIH